MYIRKAFFSSLSTRPSLKARIFGQVINEAGKIADFGQKQVRVLGSGPHTPAQRFWEYPPAKLFAR